MIPFLVRWAQAALVALGLMVALHSYQDHHWFGLWAGLWGAYVAHFQVIVVERERALRELTDDETEGT